MITYKLFEFKKEEMGKITNHLERHIKNRIENDKECNKEILLNYPVVYIHSWKNMKDELFVYIGETINLTRRTREHINRAEHGDWQNEWKAGKEHKSFYFSDSCMNKSLALDIEDSLIAIFSKIQSVNAKNGRNNQQSGYSNKNQRGRVLEEIWKELNYSLELDRSFELFEKYLTRGKDESNFENGDELVKLKTPFQVEKESEIQEKLEKMIENENVDKCVLSEYPVIYMHIWMGEDGFVHVYTGETNNLLKRTIQHYKNEKICYDLDYLLTNEMNEDWHTDWKKAIQKENQAYMYVFVRKDMNVSVTRDIENFLIRYNTVLRLSSNGRRNEQREYNNRGIAHILFTQIISYLVEELKTDGVGELFKNQKNKFCSLDDIKKKSSFMSSPLLDLSDEQWKAKDSIHSNIVTSLLENQQRLLIVDGEAGTGKTVLISSLLFDLYDFSYNGKKLETKLFINHQELFNAYTVQADARGLVNNIDFTAAITRAEEWINDVKFTYLSAILPYFSSHNQKLILASLSEENFANNFDKISETKEVNKKKCIEISKKSTYLWKNIKLLIQWAQKNNIELPNSKLDIALVDEAHLIKSTGKNGGIKEAQLPIIFDNSKVVVLMLDPKQFLDNGTQLDGEIPADTIEDKYKHFLEKHGIKKEFSVSKIAKLNQQFRMDCCVTTKKWIESLYEKGEEIKMFPDEKQYDYGNKNGDYYIYEKNENGDIVYEIGIFSSIESLREMVEQKKKTNQNPSCLVASFCWPNGKDSIFSDSQYCYKWQQTGSGADDKSISIWTMEDSLIINKNTQNPYVKIGAFHDIQGFDLNYVGVILGESIRLGRKGKNKIIFAAKRASNGKPQHVRQGISEDTPNWEKLIQNEIGVLLSRGKKGLYIYAEDEKYRDALIQAVKEERIKYIM